MVSAGLVSRCSSLIYSLGSSSSHSSTTPSVLCHFLSVTDAWWRHVCLIKHVEVFSLRAEHPGVVVQCEGVQRWVEDDGRRREISSRVCVESKLRLGCFWHWPWCLWWHDCRYVDNRPRECFPVWGLCERYLRKVNDRKQEEERGAEDREEPVNILIIICE